MEEVLALVGGIGIGIILAPFITGYFGSSRVPLLVGTLVVSVVAFVAAYWPIFVIFTLLFLFCVYGVVLEKRKKR
ncbi:MAG: hypothetical protein LBF15_04825 [Candidatus Peribacteria bacterium]|jgi:hypothetical protein|nr:hypothetical protein [Candidatus Peribacteria bacterium]